MSAAGFLEAAVKDASAIALSGVEAGRRIGQQESAARIQALESAIDKVATDIEKWFGDGIKPDEWKLQEWARLLRRVVP